MGGCGAPCLVYIRARERGEHHAIEAGNRHSDCQPDAREQLNEHDSLACDSAELEH